MKKKILIIGADERATGGVSSVNRSILQSALINSSFDVSILRTWSQSNWWATFVFALVKVRGLAKRADLLHVDVSSRGSCYRKMIILRLVGRRPYIIHLHSGDFFDFYLAQPRFIMNEISRIFEQAKKICCVSQYCAKQVVSVLGLPEGKVTCVNNGVDVKERNVVKSGGKTNVLYMGALTNHRGLDIYLSVAKAFINDDRLAFYVAGPGDQRDWKNCGVMYLGVITGKRKEQILENMDILINPFRYESFGLSMVECMNHGMACIGVKNGSIPEILQDGEAGLLANDENEIIQILASLAEDRACLGEWQKKAHARSLNFSMARFEEGMHCVYESCIK